MKRKLFSAALSTFALFLLMGAADATSQPATLLAELEPEANSLSIQAPQAALVAVQETANPDAWFEDIQRYQQYVNYVESNANQYPEYTTSPTITTCHWQDTLSRCTPVRWSTETAGV